MVGRGPQPILVAVVVELVPQEMLDQVARQLVETEQHQQFRGHLSTTLVAAMAAALKQQEQTILLGVRVEAARVMLPMLVG